MYLEAFTSHFGQIEDQRQTAKVTYPLFDILFVTFCGVIAGAEGGLIFATMPSVIMTGLRNVGYYPMGFPLTTRLPAPFHALNQRSLAPALSTGCRMFMS